MDSRWSREALIEYAEKVSEFNDQLRQDRGTIVAEKHQLVAENRRQERIIDALLDYIEEP